MRMLRFILSLALVICLLPAPSQAQQNIDWEARKQAAEIHQKLIQTQLSACAPSTATRVTFNDLFDAKSKAKAVNPEYASKCVSVEGLANWRMLTRNERSGYIYARQGEHWFAQNLREHIGIVGHEVMLSYALNESPRQGTVTGVLSDCDTLVLPMGGYCHYQGGPFLYLIEIEGEPLKARTRLTGEWAEWRYGNLGAVDMMTDAAHVEAYFDAWLNHIAGRLKTGFETIKALYGSGNDDYMNWDKYVAANSLEDIKLPFYHGLYQAFFGTDTVYQNPNLLTGERRYFIQSQPMPKDYHDIRYMSCVCLEESCEGRWPISTADDYVSPDLPYLCHQHWVTEKNEWRSTLPAREVPFAIKEVVLNEAP